MNRIINWTFGSFFRTLGRILVYLLLGFILFNLVNFKDIKLPRFTDFLFMNVFADVISLTDDTIDSYVLLTDNYTTFDTYYYLGTITSGSNNTTRYSVNALESIAQDYSFLLVDICATEDIWAYRTSQLGTNCSNSCFSNQMTMSRTTYACATGGSQGTIYRLNVPISKWQNGASTDLKNVNDRLSFGTHSTNNIPITLYGFYLSNDNIINEVGIDYTDTINNINNSISNSSIDIINNQNNNKNDIINNQNSNTQAQIDNANQNKQDIIDNQNANNQALQDNLDKQFNSCSTGEDNIFDSSNLSWVYDKTFSSNGNVVDNINSSYHFGYFNNYFKVLPNSNYLWKSNSSYGSPLSYVFFDKDKNFIGISSYFSFGSSSKTITTPNNAYFLIVQYQSNNYQWNSKLFQNNVYKWTITGATEICTNRLDETNDNLNDINNSISNTDISGASSDASNFFSNFTTDTHGLTGIITAPLNAINNLTSQTCNPLVLPLPFVDRDLTLPCMRDIYEDYFGSFMTLYDAIILGIVSYWVMVRIFSLVKDFKNPEHDEIEVVDL